MTTLPPALRLFQTKDIYLKMFNATDAGRSFSTSQEAASNIDTDNVKTSLSESSDVISNSDMTGEA